MEEKWQLNTPDDRVIYGCKNGKKPKCKQAIFIVHGLTGHMYEYPFKRAADFFESDYDVYRFNLYGGESDARDLIDCTIAQHAADLNHVLDCYAKQYEKTFLIGHSYGGTTVMLANAKNVTAVSLWDPSYDLAYVNKKFSASYSERGDHYVVSWGVSYLMSKAMYNESNSLDGSACERLSKEFSSPLQVVHAGDGFYAQEKHSYHSFCQKLTRHDLVEGTVHCFYEGSSCDELLEKTQDWFSQF